ncbi:thioredoxin-disulfide reductase [bacterium]|nr:thioredoxin-disulfide reductase [bacterium]
MSTIYDVAVVGCGPAGMTAGIYASRAMMKTVLIEKNVVGGLMALTDKLENWPGEDSISGLELAERMQKQAEKFGCEICYTDITKIEKTDRLFTLSTGDGQTISARSVIYAAGSTPRHAGIPGESEFTGRGVSYCAVCDGAFYKDLKVAVLGGGDSALKEALFLTKFASEVVIVHRRSEFRAEKITQEEVKKNQKISFVLDSVAEKIEGRDFVEKLTVKNVKTSEISTINVDGVFIFLGYDPAVDAVRDLIKLSDDGRIITDEKGETSLPGLFAAGDVISKLVNQVSTAVGDGARAAVAAERYLASK